MSVTGNDIIAALPLESGVRPTQSEILVAINYAIKSSWPNIKRVVRVSGPALSSGTIDYNISSYVGETGKWGVSRLFVVNNSGAEEEISNWRQYHDSLGNLHVTFPPSLVSVFSGKALIIQYNSPLPPVNDLSSDTGLPLDYAVHMVSSWICIRQASTSPAGKERSWVQLAEMHHQLALTALKRNTVLPDTSHTSGVHRDRAEDV